MNPTRIFSLLLAFAILGTFSHAAAQGDPAQDEPFAGAVVCEPGVYLSAPDGCLPLGPSAYLTALAQMGVTLPLRPLPAYKPSPELTLLPYKYFHADYATLPIYPSLADAQAKSANAQYFPPGFVYFSYTSFDETGHYFLAKAGFWIPGNGARVSEISAFQGLLFRETPRNAFGWTFEQIPVKYGPGYGAANTGQILNPFTIVQVYYSYVADDTIWNMIGPDQWVEGRKVAVVTPNTTPPEGVTTNRWIEVNLEEQILVVYEDNRLVFATVVATGVEPFWTRRNVSDPPEKRSRDDA